MAPLPEIAPIDRIQENLLARAERRVLNRLCAAMPGWVTPDKLTLIGMVGAVMIFTGYLASNWNAGWLLLSIAGFVLHWFGDSLDGSLARFRKIERPRYGYFLDHSCDGLATAMIVVGIGLSPYVALEAALLGLAGYLLLSIHAFLSVRVLGELIGSDARQYAWYRVTLRQGMKRQIRRMFVAVDAPVRRLVRLRFGTVRIARMQLGDVRALSAEERRQLEGLVGGDTARGDKARAAKARDDGARVPHPGARRKGLVVSVDGPGGSGKSSVGAGAAAKLGYRFCDTGVLYRGLTWLALQRGVSTADPDALAPLIGEIRLAPDEQQRFRRLIVDGRDVTDELHTAEVDREVSAVSQHARVRANLMPIQHELARDGRIVMAGRDIGTVVLPDADPKIYLDVSVEERARRRAAERGVSDDAEAVAQIADELRSRDEADSQRATAPLRIPDGATVINTDGNTLEETINQVVEVIRSRERALAKA